MATLVSTAYRLALVGIAPPLHIRIGDGWAVAALITHEPGPRGFGPRGWPVAPERKAEIGRFRPGAHRPPVDFGHPSTPGANRNQSNRITVNFDLDLGISAQGESVANVLRDDNPASAINRYHHGCHSTIHANRKRAKRQRPGPTRGPGRCNNCGCDYSPRTRLMMSLAMLGGTSMYSANCIV